MKTDWWLCHLPSSTKGPLSQARGLYGFYEGGQNLLPSFSAVPLAAGCFRTGLLEGVMPSLPRVGKEAMLGQKSSVLLSVWVLLSLLPVLAWALLADAVDTVGDSAAAGGAGSRGAEACSWFSFPSSSPGGRKTAFSMLVLNIKQNK